MSKENGFGDIPIEYSKYKSSRIVILPVPFEKTASWMKGSDKGPKAIIEASRHMELFDIESKSEPYLKGIHTAKPVKAKKSKEMIEKAYKKTAAFLADGKFVVTLGGEHTVSLGPIKAYCERWPKMSVLHLDAHGDRRDEYENNRYSHACVMARVGEFCSDIVQVGVRSIDSSEVSRMDPDKTFFASGIQNSKDWQRKVTEKLSSDVYVSIDLDVFDPAFMPSTGTPEPGGLNWYQVNGLLQMVAREKNIIGMDVVELCPSVQNPSPDFLAAKLIYKALSYISF